MACILLAAAFVIWGSQPTWRTCTLPVDPRAGTAIAIDYPDGWTPTVTNFDTGSAFLGKVTFKPQEPTGMARWWRDYVLRQKPAQYFPPSVDLTLWRNSPSNLASEEQGWNSLGSIFKNLKVARRNHALGPALEIKGQIVPPMQAPPGTFPGNRPPTISFHQLNIYLHISGFPQGACLNLNASAPTELFTSSDAHFNEMIRRVRLVQVPIHSQDKRNRTGGQTR
jgi:hypothetical protein